MNRMEGYGVRGDHGAAVRASMAVVFALAFMFVALAAFAGKADAAGLAADGGARLQVQATPYYVWVGGTQVTSANASDVLGDGRVSYNASSNTLTLRKAKVKGATVWQHGDSYRNDGIVSQTGGTLTVKLVGTSTITVPYSGYAKRCFGIDVLNSTASAQGDIVFAGAGKLTISAARAAGYSAGILANSITCKGSAKLVAKGAYATDQSNNVKRGGYGIAAKTKMRIQGKAKVTASGSTSAFYGHGFAMPTYGKGYTPQVKAGASAKSIQVNKRKPAKSVYAKYRYVSIAKASKASSGTSKKPAKMKITSLTREAGRFLVQWNKLAKNCDGYQMQVSEYSTFPNDLTRFYSLVPQSYAGAYAWGLDAGKRYYVRVRAYHQVGSKTYWGACSNVVSAVALAAAG